MKIILDLPDDQAMGLAQMCKRFCYEDAVRFANPHDGGRERDAILEGTIVLQRALREAALEGHPWRAWRFDPSEHQRVPGGGSRWNRGKDLSWEPLRLEKVAEVAFDHMQGSRFRHATHFQRWCSDKRPEDCRYDQLEVTTAYELGKIFAAEVASRGA